MPHTHRLDDNAKLSGALSAVNIQSRFVNEQNAINWFIDTPNQTIQGFVVDLKYNHFNVIFERDDHGFIFKNNHFWLIIDNDVENQIDEPAVSIATTY